jgi:hypothetical protein
LQDATYANGVLAVTDGNKTAKLSFSGTYTLANFAFASDGSGGTIVYDPPSSHNNADLSGSATIAETGGTFSDGSHGGNLALLGNHMASSFVMDSGHCGVTAGLADAAQSANQPLLASHQHV